MSLSTGVSVCVTLAHQPEEAAQKPNPLLSPLLLPPEFHIIVCGLDSIVARRWMNGMLVGKKTNNKKIVTTVDGFSSSDVPSRVLGRLIYLFFLRYLS